MSFVRARPREFDVRIRPLRRHDVAALETVFAALSARSRFFRFHVPTPRLTGALRSGLLDVDGWRRTGLVAEVATTAGRRPIGIAHLIGIDRVSAEFAVAVADSWHGQGVGRTLVTGLRDLAVELGFRRLHGDILVENRVMLRLAGSAFPGARKLSDGRVVRVAHELGGSALTDLTSEDIMADLVG